MLRKYKFLLVVMVWVLGLCSSSFGAKETVLVWESDSPERRAALVSSIADFEHLNPDIKVDLRTVSFGNNFEKIMIAIAAKDVPDTTTVWGGLVAQFAEMGGLEPLDEWGAQEVKSKIYPVGWSYGQYKGKHWALPCAIDPRFIAYDMHMFEEAGIKKVPETWEEFREAAMKTTNVAKGIYGFGMSIGTPIYSTWEFDSWMWLNEGDMLNEDMTECTVDSKEVIEAVEFLANMAKDGYFLPVPATGDMTARQLFVMGRLAMVSDGPWVSRQIAINAPDRKFERDWGIFPFPVPEVGMKKLNLATMGAYVMYKDHKASSQAVYKVIEAVSVSRANGINNFLCGKTSARVDTLDEYIIKWVFPEDEPNALREMQKLIVDSRTEVNNPLWGEITEAFQLQFDEALAGRISPAEAMKTATRDIDFILSR